MPRSMPYTSGSQTFLSPMIGGRGRRPASVATGSRRRPGSQRRNGGRRSRRGRPGRGEDRPDPLYRRACHEHRSGRAVVGAAAGVLLEPPAELGEDQDQHPLVELARFSRRQELANRLAQRTQELLVGVALARREYRSRPATCRRPDGCRPRSAGRTVSSRPSSVSARRPIRCSRESIKPRGQSAGRRVAEPDLRRGSNAPALHCPGSTGIVRPGMSRKSAMARERLRPTVRRPATARGRLPAPRGRARARVNVAARPSQPAGAVGPTEPRLPDLHRAEVRPVRVGVADALDDRQLARPPAACAGP